MRTLIRVAFVAIIASVPVLVAASEPVTSIVKSYLTIQSALASDSMKGVKEAAAAIATDAGRIGSKGDAVARPARALQQSADLKSARDAFGPLSEAVIAIARADGWSGLPDAKVAFCPMAKHSWIQTDKQIKNPYYGSKMLTCGEFKDR